MVLYYRGQILEMVHSSGPARLCLGPGPFIFLGLRLDFFEKGLENWRKK